MELRDMLERHRRRLLAGGIALSLAAAAAGGLWWWQSARWRPPPSIFDSPVDDVMGYLAMDDFSRLPVEERVRFLLEFADRFRGLEQGESALLAGFIAGLSGPARETIRQNVRLLAKDILADGARRYLAMVDEEEKRRFLDDWLADWMRTGERLARGEERDRSDEDRVAEARRDSRREAERRPDQPVTMDGADAARFLDFWQSEVESASSPKEQGQIVRFLTDLRDHLLRG